MATIDKVTNVAAFGVGLVTSSCVTKVAKAACESIIESSPELFDSEMGKTIAITLTGMAAGAAASYFVKSQIKDTVNTFKIVKESIDKAIIKSEKKEEVKPATEAA